MNRIILLYFFLLISFNSFSQIGKPVIQNYPPNVYAGDDQIWTILQDKRGVMYFGGNAGLYEYNGSGWNKYFITDMKKAVRSSVIDENGTIFIGSEEEFGCMLPDDTGRLKYISISNELDSADRFFTSIWSIAESNGNVYFASAEAVFRYNPDSLIKVKKIGLESQPFLLYKVGDDVFMSDVDRKLMKIQGDKLISMPGIKGINLWFLLPYENDKYLTGSLELGLAIYNPNAKDTSQILSKYSWFNKSDIDKTNRFLTNNQVYLGACMVDDDKYAIGTIQNGLIIVNKKGKIIEHINEDSELQSSTIHYLFKDKQNELWVGTSYGISRIEINSPFRIFEKKTGVPGSIYDIIRFKGKIYATSNLGMYYFNGRNFIGIDALTGENSVQVFSPTIYENPLNNDSIMLISTVYGTYNVQDNKAIKINNVSPTGSIIQSEYDKTKFYCTQDYKLLSFSFDGKSFSKPDTLNKFNEVVYTGIEKDAHSLWILIDEKPAVFNIHSKELEFFNFGKEFKDLRFNDVKKIREEVIFTTDRGNFKFNKKLRKFYKDDYLIDEKFSDKLVLQISEVSNQFFWTLLSDDSEAFICKNQVSDSGVVSDSIPFKRIFGARSLFGDGDSLLWIVSSKEFFKYNVNDKKCYTEQSSAIITKVKIKNDSVIYYGLFQANTEDKNGLSENNIFDYADNDISFEYSLPSFDNESVNKFSYRLLGGKNEAWSDWTSETLKDFSNLFEGKYVFNVKGKNIYGYENGFSSFYFEILPPWYRAWWAYILYVVLFSFFVYLSIKLNARRLEKENIRLDNIVKERTAEIILQKEEIQTQAENLEEINLELNQKNEEITSIAESLKSANQKVRERNIYITDSINYAKRIQKAILPSDKEIAKVLDDSFILYKPKDIVGGDFYFVKKIKKYIILAVADSTGHGVPGGFLSMMGISFLNEVVQKKTIINPNLALDYLRLKVKYSLRQKDFFTSRTDGIDMALCAINIETGMLEYSGANIPLIIVREGEIIEIKPNLQPVGIHFKEVPFELHEFQLKKNDMIYLFSDGIYDQFGGVNNKKLLIGNFKIILKRNSTESTKVQRRNILRAFNNWKGENTQMDDILLLGVRVSNFIN